MAKRPKSKKNQSSGPDKLKPEKEPQVSVRQVIRDERTHKITGAVFLLLSIFLFIAFTSYLFTWREDQDKVFRGASILLPSTDVKAENLLGNLGAYISHQFFFNGFGLASYFFCSFFFTTGANWLFARKLFSIRRNIRYVVVGVLFFSVTLAFVTRGSAFSWGGAVGEMISDWFTRFLGWIGTAALLFVSGLAYFIWRFNPVFRVPSLPQKIRLSGSGEKISEEEEARLFVDESFGINKGNLLKGDTGMLTNLVQANEEKEMPGMTIIEKDEDEEDSEAIAPVLPETKEVQPVKLPNDNKPLATEEKNQKKTPVLPELELEVKQTEAASVTGEHALEIVSAKQEPLPDYEPTLDLRNYRYPSLELLEAHGSEKIIQDPAELEANKNQIIGTLKNYDIDIQKISATVGPTVTLYEIVPAPGVRISRIKNLEDDIALSLAALGIRIIAPIPGKGTIGIEVPNIKKTVVSMRTLLSSEKFQHNNFNLPIAIGKKIDNENFIVDLSAMPHLLMAGATGQGKSVGLNAILVSLLYKKHPSQLKLVLVDPKKVELSLYRTIEKHFLAKLPGEEEPIITDTKKVIHTLNALCIEMDNRYDLLKEAGARNIREYNEKFIKRRLNPQKGHQYLPFIVLVIDEFADLIMTAGKEVEMPIARLAQLARAVGIHLIIATQRPSVNIITGTIKANFPARIAFKVSSKIDSRTILDTGGAEQLIGKGDMLVSYNGELTRLQCAFVDTPEVDEITEFIGNQQGYPQA
ncbi:MAG TPA: DNA translocase FtsK 4TM domain-containing protein, partial [Puia sp.]|nr:DNA translocase FtsK 4TM domain-containing protein [Puia sp.]